jgi:hypothetical protein
MWDAIAAMTTRPRRPIDRADYGGAERTAALLVDLVGRRPELVGVAS